MSGKAINRLTITELKRECDKYKLSRTGSKADLEIRLTEHRAKGVDLETYGTGIKVDNVNTETTSSEGAAGSSHELRQPTQNEPDDTLSNMIDLNASIYVANTTQAAYEQLGEIRQAIPNTPITPSLEARLSTLELSLARYLDDQRLITESIRRIELGMSSSRLECNEVPIQRPHTHESTHIRENDGDPTGIHSIPVPPIQPFPHSSARVPGINQPLQGIPPAREIGGAQRQTDTYNTWYDVTRSAHAEHTRSVHFAGPHNDYRVPNSSAYAPDRSVLIPYEDLRAARASLPEFSGTKAEDPVRFLENSEQILSQARIPPAGWIRAVESQLTGSAGTWWTAIKVLDLTWQEFRDEFLDKFDNAEIQAQLRAEIMSMRQSANQSITEFVLVKNQLARRVNTGLSELHLVGIIAGLMRDEFRVHVRLQRPMTFGDLRRIAGVLDPSTNTHTQHPKREPPEQASRGRYNSNRGTPRQPTSGQTGRQVPPWPCRYCGEDHWNSECPNRPTFSGNGRGAGRM